MFYLANRHTAILLTLHPCLERSHRSHLSHQRTRSCRVQDAASIAANGLRSAVKRIAQPAARDAVDCENAALAILDDATQRAWAGTYETISDFMPSGAGLDPWPGDVWTINAPSRNANF